MQITFRKEMCDQAISNLMGEYRSDLHLIMETKTFISPVGTAIPIVIHKE